MKGKKTKPRARPRSKPPGPPGSPHRRGARRKPTALQSRLDRWRERGGKVRRVVRATPPAIRTVIVLAVAVGLFLLANLIYHVARKPTEMLYPVSGVLKKKPTETWREYGPLFREYSTGLISPEILAALAQVEGAGDPVAHTYWRWRLAWPPFEIYKPASSAVGMYQITDGTYADAQRYCIRHHTVIERGASDSGESCRSEDLLYNRLLPSHAIEMTSAHLDRAVAAIIGRQSEKASAKQRQDTAALVHLCGAGVAKDFARNGFRLVPGEMCGDHLAAGYVGQVEVMVRQFQRLNSEGEH